jgi:hypothetical protein
MTKNYYEGIREIKEITPMYMRRCDPCGFLPSSFSDNVNHYITHHNFKLLHIGSQSGLDENGNLVSDVIAILGK